MRDYVLPILSIDSISLRIIQLMFIAVSLFGCIACNESKVLPKTGPVEYPPSWPVPELTAIARTNKRQSTLDPGYVIRGQESKWYVDNAASQDSPSKGRWIVNYYYYGVPEKVYEHVENCLNDGGLNWSVVSKLSYAGKRDRPHSRLYEFAIANQVYRLSVVYNGHYDEPYVSYLIYIV